MIPPFDPDTGNLPPGTYVTSFAEVGERFGWNEHRRVLLRGLRQLLENLSSVGCRRVYLDGSFVTSTVMPNDFDACWDGDGVSYEELELLFPELLDFSNQRASQKAKYGGEIFPNDFLADFLGRRILEFFQIDRKTGASKGILAIGLDTIR